jgi:hypothetical protein
VIAATDQSVEVWPENWPTFALFAQLGTQWAAGMGGPTGLRYEALYPLLDRRCPSDDEWQQTFDDVRTMETAALAALRSKD